MLVVILVDMKYPKIAELIVQLVHSDDYRPVKPKALIKQLGLNDDDYASVRRTVKDLTKRGQIQYGSNHLVMPAVAKSGDKNVIKGTFRETRSGFGFVRPVPADRHISADDVFIPEAATKSALEGDLVEVRVRSGREGKLEGSVREILERAKRQFSGTFVLIDDAPRVWLDGVQQDQPVEVGDVRGLPINEGDKVVVELVEFPDAMQPGEGVIMEVLGSSKNPAVDTKAIMFQYGLSEDYPEDAIAEARASADRFDEDVIPDGRRDLTKTPTLTIDPFDARDFDDAISLSKNEAGHWELLVHIADVSAFVPVGGRLDEEAKARATSVYLPDKVVPMIPEIISNHLASLQPDKNRFAKTVWIEYTSDGKLVQSEVFNSVIRNQQRLNYEQVDQFLENRQPWRKRLEPGIFELLSNMYELAMVLRQRRKSGGSLELSLPEIKVDLDKQGKVRGAHLTEHSASHQIIEEFMLAGNQAVATWLDDLKLPFLRRAHAPPARQKMRKLTDFVRGLGIDCENLESRFELQRIVDAVGGTPMEYAVNYAILKSMSKAVYQPEKERHYALDMTHYCHFTSPIRRYPDLIVHRIAQKLIDGENAREPMPKLIELGEHCSDREQNADQAERALTHVKLLHFMDKKVGQEIRGIVVAVRPNAVVVRGKEVPVEGVIPVDSLPDDRYRFDKWAHTLEGFRKGNSFRLGDELLVRIDRVDLARRELFLGFVQHLQARTPVAQQAKQKGLGARKDKRPRSGSEKTSKPKKFKSKNLNTANSKKPSEGKQKTPAGRNDPSKKDGPSPLRKKHVRNSTGDDRATSGEPQASNPPVNKSAAKRSSKKGIQQSNRSGGAPKSSHDSDSRAPDASASNASKSGKSKRSGKPPTRGKKKTDSKTNTKTTRRSPAKGKPTKKTGPSPLRKRHDEKD